MWVKKQQLELVIEQQTGSKLETEYGKAVYCYPVYLTYMQNTSHELLSWTKHKLESRLPEEIATTSDRRFPLMVESEEELKNLLISVKEEKKLKTQY